jgi:hypothetical protein
MRLKVEAKRLLYCIVKVVQNSYTLICSIGPLNGSHITSQLNEVISLDESSIPLDFANWKGPKLTLPKAVAKINNRGTISTA